MKWWLVFSCLLFFRCIGYGGETISLEQYLDLVRTHHPLISAENLSPEIEAERQSGFMADEDWVLGGRASLLHSKPIVTSSFSPTTLDLVGLSASLSRSFWSTGGRFGIEWSTDFTDQTLPDLSFPGSESGGISAGTPRLYEHALSLSYTQPLWRNYGGDLSRLDYDLAAHTISISELEAIENQEQFLLEIALNFVDWVLLEEQKKITEQRLQLAREQLELTTEKRRANLVDQVDVLRSEDAVRAARQNAVLLDSRARARKAELALLAQADSIRQLQPAYDLYRPADIPGFDEARAVLEENSRLLNTLQARREQLERLDRSYDEWEKPNLDLNIGLAIKGGDDAFGNSLELTKPDFSLSLLLRQPLGAKAARSGGIQTELEIRQNRLRYQQVRLDLESSLDALLIQLADLEEIMRLNREEIESAREKAAEELKLYEQGRGELTFVIQARDNEQNARLLYAENAANYHRLYHQYLALTDLFLENNR